MAVPRSHSLLHDATHIAHGTVEMHNNDALRVPGGLALNVVVVDGVAYYSVTTHRSSLERYAASMTR